MNRIFSLLIRILSIILQLAYVKSYTHYLSLAELGYSFYLSTLSYAINAFVLVPADFYQQALLARTYEGVFPLGFIVGLNKRILSLAAAIAIMVGVPICIAGKLSVLDLFLIFGLAIFLYFSTSFRNYLNNRGHGLFTGWMLLMEAGLKLSSFLAFLAVGMPHITAFVLSTVTAFLIEVICLGIFFHKRVPYTLSVTEELDFKSLLRASSPVSFAAVCNWLQLQGYRVVYVWLGLAEVAGLYAAVSNLGIMGMNASSTVFSQMLLPRVYASRGAYIFTYLKYAALLCLVVLLGYIALGKGLLLVLTKKQFEPYAGLMLFGILVEAGNLMIGGASTYFTIRHRSFHLLGANVAGLLTAAMGVTLCLVWRRHTYALLGATLVVSQAVVCAALFFRVRANLSREAIHV